MLKKFILIFAFLFIAQAIAYCIQEDILWEKYYNGDSLAGCTPAWWQNSLDTVNNKLLITYYGSILDGFPNSGFLKTDFNGNIENRKEFLKNRLLQIDKIIYKNNQYHIFSKFDYYDTSLYSYFVDFLPHKYILDNDLNIVEEIYDTLNWSYHTNGSGALFIEYGLDSVYVRRTDLTKDCTPYDLIAILDFSTKFIRNINVQNFRPSKNKWAYFGISDFLITKDKKFIHLTHCRNGHVYTEESNLICIDYEGKIVWSTKIKYNDKKTYLKRVLETKEGDFLCYGNTLPDISDTEIEYSDTLQTQMDSLLIVKVKKNGEILWMKEYPLNNKTKFDRNFKMIMYGQYYALFGNYLLNGNILINKTVNCIYLINSEGDIIYSKSWSMNDDYFNSIGDIIGIDDNLLVFGYEYNASINKDMFLVALKPEIEAIEENNVKNNGEIIIYPNPSNNNFNIQYNLDNYSYLRITLNNSIGELCEILWEGSQEGGNHKMNFTLSKNYSPGIYWVKLETGNGKVMAKPVVIGR